jgi:hypothetical protein
MIGKRSGRYLVYGLCIFAALLSTSCATSRGATLGKVISTQAGTGPAANPPSSPTVQPVPSPLVAKKGLEIVSSPDSAEVWIDGVFRGLSPYIVDNIGPGWHRVSLRKQGYYEAAGWVDFETDYQLYQATLTPITGFLQISVTPPDSIVTVGGQKVEQGIQQLPVGTYVVTARSFGYVEGNQSVTVTEQATSTVSLTLASAPFAISSVTLPKENVNPANPGLLGSLDCNFTVTGPGSGEMKVTDASSAEVFMETLSDFTTWDQSFSWNLRDASGRILPDGDYTMTIIGRGKSSDASVSAQVHFRVDSTLKIAPRSLWSGSAGLLYAPVAEVLPPGDFQLSLLGAGIAASNPSVFQAPMQIGARVGLGHTMELDAAAGFIASSVSTPFTASAAGRWNFASPHGEYGTGAALQAKLSFQYNPALTGGNILLTDTFANFTGISIELPLQFALGPVSLMLSLGATGSLWYPYRSDASGAPISGGVTWLYIRTGALLDLGSFSTGISLSTRTQPLPGGVGFLGSPVPFQLGAEVHWLIPGSRLFISAIIAGEYENSANYYFMGGAGLGFLY